MPYIKIHAAKTNLSKLIARVASGEEIIIARGSEPIARLIPIDHPNRGRKFGALRGKVAVGAAFFEALPADELAHWEK